jgi:hypothetical protein
MKTKKLLVFLVTAVLVSGLTLFSAGDAKKPVVKKGAEVMTIKGHLRSWKDCKKIDLSKMTGPRKLKPVMNFENPRKIVKKTDAEDPVVQTSDGLKREALAMDTPLIDFAGMNLSANGAGWPPDTNGDVGPTYFIQTVNTSIGIYNKSTGALVSATTFDSFFGGTGISGTPCDEDNYGDPIVLYDRYSQRWFILDFAWYSNYSGGSWYSIAVSKTSDPTGDWWQYALNADTTLMNDYPKCGIWHDGIYITANMFQFSGSFQHVKVWALEKPDIYNGTLNVQTVTDSSYEAFSLLPANAIGSTAPVGPNYMYAMDADEYGSPSIDAIYVWKYDVDWTTPANTTWTGHWTMNTAAFGLTASRVPQMGTSNTLDSLYGRLMYPANYRNFGTHESVYVCHVCEYNSTRQMRWYEIRINSGTSSIYQQGTYAPDTDHRWMGAIAADADGNIAMGYSVSSSTMYPAIRYCGRLATDPLGQMSQGEASMVEGTGYQSSYTRWGDYSSMFVDDDDDMTFWYTQEYYTSSGTNWQTRIGSFKFDTTPVTPPDAPTALSATAVECNEIDLSWTDNADNESGFYIERGTDGSNFSQIDTVGANITSYNDTSVAQLTTYYYRVRAYNSGGTSAYTNTANDTTPECTGSAPNAPTMTLIKGGPGRVTLGWTDNASDEDGYKVYRGTSSGSLSLVATLSANTTSYTDTGLARKTTYYYKVCAYNTYGEGCTSEFSVRTR